jgi:ribosome-binding protein aMBF1 (putative translation factor)
MNHEDVKQRLLQNPQVRERYENPPLRLAVARAVVESRRALGMSQEELAERLQTSQNQVYRIESGAANINVKTLEKLHDVLGLEFIVHEPQRPISMKRSRTVVNCAPPVHAE